LPAETNPDNGLVAAEDSLTDAENNRATGSIAEIDCHLFGEFPQLCSVTILVFEGVVFPPSATRVFRVFRDGIPGTQYIFIVNRK